MSETREANAAPADSVFVEDTPEDNLAAEKYLIFSILGRRYTFPSSYISEIAVFETVYPLPLMPGYVLGIINRYSVPYVLFDIGLLLLKTPTPRGKVLVFKDQIDRIAFLIDDITDIADIPQTQVIPVERSSESGDLAEIIAASFRWHENDVFVLDIERILSRVTGETSE
jgi:purine-binding chemotaxis protein CheW